MSKQLPDGNCLFLLLLLLRSDLLISNRLFILLCNTVLFKKFCLITCIFETMSSQNNDYNTRSKEATSVTDILPKIENNLETSISDVENF